MVSSDAASVGMGRGDGFLGKSIHWGEKVDPTAAKEPCLISFSPASGLEKHLGVDFSKG